MRNSVAAGMLALVFVFMHCGGQRVTAVPAPFRNSGVLSNTDLALRVPGLGPCTDNPDRTIYLDSNLPVTILVHGCNGSAGRFQALAEVFAFHGQQTIGFSYDDRDDMMVTSGQLAQAIHTLSAKLNNKQITVIGHSQGALLARKALVSGRPNAIQDADLQIRLVTISGPFSGIRAANHCGSPTARVISLGLVVPICHIVTGAKWRDIVYNGAFITQPGQLIPQVNVHLKINTDERDSCLRLEPDGSCQKQDFTFSLEEQHQPIVDTEACVKMLDVKAGHVEIVGDRKVIPAKLIAVLQQEGILLPTKLSKQGDFATLLARLYLDASSVQFDD
jgi:hypothetical protein